VRVTVFGMKRVGLLLVVGLLAAAVATPSGASAVGPVAVAAKKKCKKHKGGGKKKHKKCKKKKHPKPTPSYPSPLVISPASWDFGGFPIGLAGGSQQFTITNPTAGPIGPVSTAITGANPGSFRKAGDNCVGQSLSAGASCSLFIGCVGSGSTPATFTAALLIGNPGGSVEAALTCRQF
jgi:hypothetical protein